MSKQSKKCVEKQKEYNVIKIIVDKLLNYTKIILLLTNVIYLFFKNI